MHRFLAAMLSTIPAPYQGGTGPPPHGIWLRDAALQMGPALPGPTPSGTGNLGAAAEGGDRM
jgi:hypothetical protein